ncbi:MAG TPA: glycosyltransferase [Noviherbaspirillum sp.]|jgi:4-amino-4-deoxy-L-arabinose transferase-like glycosyltransferase|uniref:ArnT family glycosyltransferase n=1 Tax=Noviherbaspirillum sp. TaxID=1926288 RepID=UPI002DDD30D6|nr:glycosyltransferase [Noviherbaspirillum sp.]HEV2612884.1 glycosyltransferase [Noviherbaspirillum sp.]
MKPVRLPASATNALPRWGLFALCLIYILSGLFGRDPWKTDDAAGFGVMWTMANGGLEDWLWPHIVGLPMADEGPLAYWIGALCIKLFGWLLGDALAARIATAGFFLLGSLSVWYATYQLGRRSEAQPLRLAFGGQPEPRDFGRTLADGALLIYLGCLGLLLHSHYTSAKALHVSLIALAIYATVRLFEKESVRTAAGLGAVLGLLVLTRGWVAPLALWLAIAVLAGIRSKALMAKTAIVSLATAVAISEIWLATNYYVRPFNSSPFDAWMLWNHRQISLPSIESIRYFTKNVIWFAWPAWPYAGWAVYAWRKQFRAIHIAVPLAFAMTFIVLALINGRPDEGILLPLLPPLAILAAFGLPTMKRGAINAVDWFSVMTLTTCAAFIWLGWIAKQTGWPAKLAKNAFKLAPGFKPEFSLVMFLVAVCVTIGWILLVHWRVSRRPAVLWRAVVLSSGGVILCWVLLTTLWLPWVNYGKSYSGVALQMAEALPEGGACVETNVGPAQRASFAYFGKIPFADFDDIDCDLLLLQDDNRRQDNAKRLIRADEQWRLLWEGRRASDRHERFRLYQKVKR